MRVLHVSPYFAPAFCYGGPPRTILGLCRAEQRLGIDVSVFTTTACGQVELPSAVHEPELYDEIPVFRFPLGLAARFFDAPQLPKSLVAQIQNFDLVHIHCLWNLTGWRAAKTCIHAGLPYVVSTRGMLLSGARRHHAWRKRMLFPVERQVLQHASLLHVTSEEEIADITGLRIRCRALTIPNGVELPGDIASRAGTFRSEYGIDERTPIVAWLGRIHPIKRLDLLAEAFQKVKTSPMPILVLAGPDEKGFRAQVEPLFRPLGDSVLWTGELDSTRKWNLLADASVLVACSETESFGMSIVEAMACGTPVVVTETCPWREVESENCGRWVKHDADNIATAITELLSDLDRARRMGERARQLVLKKYSWDSVAQQMTRAYDKILAEGRGREA